MNIAILGPVALAFLLFAPLILSPSGGPAEAISYAVSLLMTVSSGSVLYAYCMELTEAFNGAGAVWTPTIINLFCFWLWELPLGWFLAFPLGLGPNGIFTAMMVAFSTVAVVSGVLFKRGRWREAAV